MDTFQMWLKRIFWFLFNRLKVRLWGLVIGAGVAIIAICITAAITKYDIDQYDLAHKNVKTNTASANVFIPDESIDSNNNSASMISHAFVPVDKILLECSEITVYTGGKVKVNTETLPKNASNKEKKWESCSTSIATVDKDGNITGVSEGKCYIIVSSVSDITITNTITVTVKKEPK